MKSLKIFRYPLFSITILLTLVLVSCKSSKEVIASGEVSSKLSAKQVIKQHQKNAASFNTMQAKVRIDILDGDKTQGLTFNFRMQRDKAIWLSAPLGLARLMVTPEKVRFYSKQDNEYFDGDYELLSSFVGIELDYNKVQNILLGQAIFDLNAQPHRVDVNENAYALSPKNQNSIFELFYLISPTHFKMESLQLFQQMQKRILQVDYKSYQKVDKSIIPQNINIIAVEDTDEVKMAMEFKSVSLNQELRFPFRIPKGYKEIVIR